MGRAGRLLSISQPIKSKCKSILTRKTINCSCSFAPFNFAAFHLAAGYCSLLCPIGDVGSFLPARQFHQTYGDCANFRVPPLGSGAWSYLPFATIWPLPSCWTLFLGSELGLLNPLSAGQQAGVATVDLTLCLRNSNIHGSSLARESAALQLGTWLLHRPRLGSQ